MYAFGTGRAEVPAPDFQFDGTIPVRTAEDLLYRCAKSPTAGASHLASGELERWLKSIDRGELALLASESRRTGDSQEEALYLFIEFARIQNYLRRTPGRKLTVLTIGRTGVGKSSIINTLAGRAVAETGAGVPVTAHVYSYEIRINGVPSRVIDTPGLCDGKNLDDSYMNWIRNEVGRLGVDCVLFVTPLYDTRVRTDEIHAIEIITKTFGASIWQRSLVMLTFSDYISDATRYATRVERRPVPIKDAITTVIADPAIAEAIPFIPLTNESMVNPDGRRWLGAFYLTLLDRMAPEGTSLFYSTAPDGGRLDSRFRCYRRDGGPPPPYRFICRSEGSAGTCSFCGLPYEKIRH